MCEYILCFYWNTFISFDTDLRANSESSASKNRRSSNKENTVKGNKPDFKISTNARDEILFGEVKPKDSSSILVKKDYIKLADFQAGTLDELIKKYGNKTGMASFGIWVCGKCANLG